MAHSPHILIVGVNWIGDGVMAMPAIQAYRRQHPAHRITMLVKPSVQPLWALHRAPNDVCVLAPGIGGLTQTLRRLRALGPFDRAYILPHSFRSALIPWMLRIRERYGMPGHARDGMLTHRIQPALGEGRIHQVYEYYDLLLEGQQMAEWEPPSLSVPDALPSAWCAWRAEAEESSVVAFMPGAARGPSKQWPPESFIELGRRLTANGGCRVAVLGAPGEQPLCRAVADGIGPAARSWAGETSFTEWVALCSACSLAVANDSGGMHLAAALAVPLVALYGMTDPATTGPLSRAATICQNATKRHRDIPRDSAEARAALASIHPETVYEACRLWLERTQESSLR